MNLYRINLNLLVALNILLQEKSVTQSAKKLFITQAAMSNNLNQLRHLFKDELLIREKNKMSLTSFAKELQGNLHKVLLDVEKIIANKQVFEPTSTERAFKIGMIDYMAAIMLPKIVKILEKKAPNLQLNIITVNQLNERIFENNDLDMVISKCLFETSITSDAKIFDDKMIVLLNKKHSLASKRNITLKDYLSYKHVAVRVDDDNIKAGVDQALEKIKQKRDIAVASPFIVPIFKIIEHSPNLIATVIKSVAEFYQTSQFVIKELPFNYPEISYHLIWHKCFDNDLGHRWLRDVIIECLQ